jgi:hypothetical protein
LACKALSASFVDNGIDVLMTCDVRLEMNNLLIEIIPNSSNFLFKRIFYCLNIVIKTFLFSLSTMRLGRKVGYILSNQKILASNTRKLWNLQLASKTMKYSISTKAHLISCFFREAANTGFIFDILRQY